MRRLVLLMLLLATPLAAFERGQVFFQVRTQHFNETGLFLRFSQRGFNGAGGLADVPVTFDYPGQFLAPAPNRILFHDKHTMSVWDGVSPRFTNLFTDDAELSEIAPGSFGHYLVAERFADPVRGARLIEFDLNGVVTEHPFPQNIVNGIAVGASHIELLADHCTLLFTTGDDDPHGNRVRRMNICTNQPEPDFATLVGGFYAGSIRQLPNGDVLVANGDPIFRFNLAGSMVDTYHLPGVKLIALADDAATFWAVTVDANRQLTFLHELPLDARLPSRAVLIDSPGSSNFLLVDVTQLVVVSEWRAAVDHRVRAIRRR